MRSSGLMNFMAGVAASAGTSLILTMPAGSTADCSKLDVVTAGTTWLLLAGVLALEATWWEDIASFVRMRESPSLSLEERTELVKEGLRRKRVAVRLCDGVIAVLFVLAIWATWMVGG